jgi:6-phospho-3-hexuloisomerase
MLVFLLFTWMVSGMEIREIGNGVLREISSGFNKLAFPQIGLLVEEIRTAKRIFCIGAGRSRIMLTTFCMRLNHLGFEAYMAGNIPCPPARKGDLVIAASGSGDTPSVFAVLKRAQADGARIALLTAADGKNEEADLVVTIAAPNGLINKDGESGQLMRTLFEQILFILGETLIMVLSEAIPVEEIAARHTNLE